MSKVTNELKNDPLMPVRHTAEHVLHTAMQELFPDLKKVMGPPIEDGFYFDFDLDQKISPEDFEKIEAKMHEIVKTKLPVIKHEVTAEEAKTIFKDNPYKLENIEEIGKRGEKVTLYAIGKEGDKHYDLDLCAGPHVKNTGDVKAFRLLTIAGAYYKGSEKNKMLQRIYATAFDTPEALLEHINNLEEAKKRDHKKLGPELELFMFHDTAPGSPYWLPKGMVIYNELINFWRIEHAQRGYKEISSPLVNKKELWETSGHWDHYKDDMFICNMGENEVYGVKPMNCPNAMIVFGSKTRSYKDLPLRFSDTDILHRYERSGTLNGLLRVRSFKQDDSHNFITEDQIEAEYEQIFEIAEKFYGIFGLEFRYRLGTRPEKFMGDIETWNKAEKALHNILTKTVGKNGYTVEEGDGAFYGPKVDIIMKDFLGRDWQMGTIQLDFQIPRRFNLKYIDKEGSQQTPIVVHRVIYGSLERFIGILIEQYAGAFPVWISPVQVQIIPIADKHNEYAKKVQEQLLEAGLRAEVDTRTETMQAKIRDAQNQKIPYMLIVGDREAENGQVSVRLRTGENIGAKPVEEVIKVIATKYLTKAQDLW